MIDAINASVASDVRNAATDAVAVAVEPLMHPQKSAYNQSDALSIASACDALGIARSTFYRYRKFDPFNESSRFISADPDVEMRDRIQRVALEWPSYGYASNRNESIAESPPNCSARVLSSTTSSF